MMDDVSLILACVFGPLAALLGFLWLRTMDRKNAHIAQVRDHIKKLQDDIKQLERLATPALLKELEAKNEYISNLEEKLQQAPSPEELAELRRQLEAAEVNRTQLERRIKGVKELVRAATSLSIVGTRSGLPAYLAASSGAVGPVFTPEDEEGGDAPEDGGGC